MEERLQKLLSQRGVASRREAEQMILAGRVTVDGQPAQLGQRADADTQQICVDGRPLGEAGERVYIMLNKPVGYVTTVRDDRGRRTVMELTAEAGQGLWPVGRLDLNSQGLLLMTNDGEITNRLTHPSYEVEKAYQVWVNGTDIPAAARRLTEPMDIEGCVVQAVRVRLLRQEGDRGVLEVVIREGRNRQVRKMCDQAGLGVHRLVRVAEGKLRLGKLPNGKWRYLTAEEIGYLKSI